MKIIFSLFPENTGTDVIISHFRTDTHFQGDITRQKFSMVKLIDTDIKLELSLACHIFSSLSAVITFTQFLDKKISDERAIHRKISKINFVIDKSRVLLI